MPLKNYGVLAGQVVDRRAEGGSDTPHFQIQVRAAGVDNRVAVNVMSADKSELLYLADEHFSHPVLPLVAGVADGITSLPPKPATAALDFIRGNLFDRTAMKPMPATAPGPDNDLADKIAHYVDRAQADPTARLYAFGEAWGPEPETPDKIFGFLPGRGVHDIHMNQGNDAGFARDDGVWQDGGLLFQFPATSAVPEQWVAVFLAFQSQAWHTDEVTGHALGDDHGDHGVVPDGTLRIVAALVNPVGPAPEQETITLINPGLVPVDLTGWSVLDRNEHSATLDPQVIPPGEAVRITLRPPVQLGNSGGLLTLLNPAGLKVDGISYTKDQARTEGRSLVF